MKTCRCWSIWDFNSRGDVNIPSFVQNNLFWQGQNRQKKFALAASYRNSFHIKSGELIKFFSLVNMIWTRISYFGLEGFGNCMQWFLIQSYLNRTPQRENPQVSAEFCHKFLVTCLNWLISRDRPRERGNWPWKRGWILLRFKTEMLANFIFGRESRLTPPALPPVMTQKTKKKKTLLIARLRNLPQRHVWDYCLVPFFFFK